MRRYILFFILLTSFFANANQVSREKLRILHLEEISWAKKTIHQLQSMDIEKSFPYHFLRLKELYKCWEKQKNDDFIQTNISNCRVDFILLVNNIAGSLHLDFVSAPKFEDFVSSKKISKGRTSFENGIPVYYDMPVYFSEDFMNRRYVIYFDYNKFNSFDKSKIKHIMDYINQKGYSYIEVEGHTDRSGSSSFNMDLSKKRALTVKKELVNSGVPATNIDVFAYGEDINRVKTKNGVSNSKNRRVEVKIVVY